MIKANQPVGAINSFKHTYSRPQLECSALFGPLTTAAVDEQQILTTASAKSRFLPLLLLKLELDMWPHLPSPSSTCANI